MPSAIGGVPVCSLAALTHGVASAIAPNMQHLTVRFVTERSGHRVQAGRLPGCGLDTCPWVSLEGSVNAIGHEQSIAAIDDESGSLVDGASHLVGFSEPATGRHMAAIGGIDDFL